MSEQDDIRVERIVEILDALKSSALSPDERANLELELDKLGRVIESTFAGSLVVCSVTDRVFSWLTHRQESVPIDFDAIRRRKAQLDNKLFGEQL